MGAKEKGQGGGGGWQSRQAPQRIPERHSHPATTRASSPQGATVARSASAARVQSRGCKGRSPLHKKTKNLPLPHGGRALCERGSGGWGKNFLIWLVNPATKKSSHPSKPTAAKKTVSRRRRTPLPPCSQSTSSTRQSGRTVRSDGCSTYRRINLKAEA